MMIHDDDVDELRKYQLQTYRLNNRNGIQQWCAEQIKHSYTEFTNVLADVSTEVHNPLVSLPEEQRTCLNCPRSDVILSTTKRSKFRNAG